MIFQFSTGRDAVRRRLLIASAMAVALAPSTAAWAQTAPVSVSQTAQAAAPQTAQAPAPQTAQAQTAQSKENAETITVTGTRIVSPGLVSSSPITTLTSVEIEETGLQNLSQILAQSPQFSNNQGPSNASFFVNGANIDAANLRGLGAYRTLTLIDGIRQVGQLSGVNNSGGTGIVDLNTISPLAIDRIDIVTGGESALYGADAVAGVVNIKLKKNYEGAEADIEYGTTTDGGGTTTSFDGIFGANFAQDRGNITVTTDYANTAAINGFERPTQAASGGPFFSPTGNPSVVQCCAANALINQNGAPVVQTQIGNNAPGTLTFNQAGTQLLPFNPGTLIPGTNGTEAFAGTGQAQVLPNQILEAGGVRFVEDSIVTYKVAEDLGPFASINANLDVKFASSRGENWDSFQPLQAGLGNPPSIGVPNNLIVINAGNPFIPTALAAQLAANNVSQIQLSRSLNDWDTRLTRYDYETNRDVFGFSGELKNGWNYQTYYNFGRNEDTFINGSGSVTNLNNALNVVTGANGAPVCADTLVNPTDGCIPINPFKVGALTQAQQRFVFFDSKEIDVTEENNWAFNLNGDAFHYNTPFTNVNVPLGFAFGLEWREESTNSLIDAPSQQAVGSNAPNVLGGSTIGGDANLNQTFSNANSNGPTSGIYTTKEAYLELSVPVLRDLPFAKAVDIGGAIRGQDYSSTGDDYTWNLHATWAFTSDLSFRASVGKSVRAPNGDELFSSGGQSFVPIADPCSIQHIGLSATRTANCRAAGVPVGFNANNSAESSTFLGGNPNLEAETGRDVSAGFVFTPTFIPRFTSTFDFYKIDIQNPISFSDTNQILDGCFDSGIQADCRAISRRSDGSVAEISTPYVNGAFEKIFGFDWGTQYRVSDEQLPFLPPSSNINLHTDLSYVPQHYLLQSAQDPAGSELALAGQYGFQRWTGSFGSEYTQGPITASFTERFIGESTLFEQGSGQLFSPETLATQWYTDASVSYTWKNFQLTAGVQNLFDNLPPAAAAAAAPANGNAGPGAVARPGEEAFQNLDLTGRFVFTKLKVSF
jgi:iron complex outermembrane receptor protein